MPASFSIVARSSWMAEVEGGDEALLGWDVVSMSRARLAKTRRSASVWKGCLGTSMVKGVW